MTIKTEKKYNAAILWYNMGVELEDAGKFEDAIISYDKALELDPNDTDTWCSKGNALASLQRFRLAIKSYDQAIKIDPGNNAALNNKSYALHKIGDTLYKEGKKKEAELYFKKARNILR